MFKAGLGHINTINLFSLELCKHTVTSWRNTIDETVVISL